MLSYKYLLPFKAFYMSYKNISRSEIFQLFLFVEVIFIKALSNDIIVKYFIDIATEVG